MNAHSYPTPLGPMTFCEEGGALYAADLRGSDQGEETPVLREAHRQIDEYFAGKRTVFTLSLSMRGTPFQKKVWQALLSIPFGQTVSYGDIARKIGQPKAAQAVGQAVSANPLMIIVPCHRVIAGDGTIGGYYGGLPLKRKIFAYEKIKVKEKGTLL